MNHIDATNIAMAEAGASASAGPAGEPPHSVEAEQSVLGAVMLDNACFDRVADLLQPAAFYRHEHRTIWDVVARMVNANKPADLLTVADELQRMGKADDVGGLRYLNALVQSVPSAAHARRYAEIVRERHIERELMRVAREVGDAAPRPGRDAMAKIDDAMAKLSKLADGRIAVESTHIDQAVVDYLDHLQAEADGKTRTISTGLRRLDNMLAGGLRAGELMVIGARPKMGKTALVLSLARSMAATHGVLVLSQEMPKTELVARNVAALGSVNLADLRRGSNIPQAVWEGVTEAVDRMRGLALVLDDQRALTLMDVRRKVMDCKRRHGVDVVIVDFLQLMSGEGDNRNQELDRISNGLKAMAGEFGVAVVLLSQLSREADKRSGPPVMTDLRDSGAIEAAADIIALLFREFAHPLGQKGDEWRHYAQLEIVQRNGAPGHISLHFSGEFQRFGDWDGPLPQKPYGGRGAAKTSRGMD